jgi:hypothetical protein
MNFSNPAVILIGIPLIVFLIGRQFTPQPVKQGRFWLFPLAITVYGLYLIYQTPPGGPIDIALLAVNLVAGAVLGFGRGATMKLWRTPAGRLMQQGTLLTFGLWLLTIGVRIGLGLLAGGAFHGSELPIELGVTLGAQAVAMLLRMESLGSRAGEPYFEAVR